MSSPQVLDVNGLFHKFTVEEIREIEKKLKNDVEKKKEDLRNMVGRRYRDIIEAADNIKQMKMTSDSVLQNLRDVQSCFQSLQVLQNRMISSTQRAQLTLEPVVDTKILTNTRVKILLELPEKVWECLDHSDYLEASWCLMVVEQLCNSVELHPSQQQSNDFLVRHQRSIKRLKQKVKEACDCALADSTLPIDAFVNLFAAVLMLDHLDFKAVLTKFLAIRQKRIAEVITDSTLSSRDQMLMILGTFFQTVLVVDKVFVAEVGQNELLQRIKHVVSQEWTSAHLHSFLKHQTKIYETVLLETEKTVRLSLKGIETFAIDGGFMRICCTGWIKEMERVIDSHVASIFVHYDSIESMTTLKTSLLGLFTEICDKDVWMQKSPHVLGEQYHPWDNSLSLIVKSLQQICNQRLSEILRSMWATLNQKLQQPSSSASSFSDFLWAELPTDCAADLLADGETSTLQLKAKGYNRDTIGLAVLLEREISGVKEALLAYTECCKGSDILSHTEDLVLMFRRTCLQCLRKFTGDIEIHFAQNDSDIVKDDREHLKRSLVFCFKLCSCLAELCPELKQSLNMFVATSKDHKTAGDSEEWKQTKVCLLDCSNECLKRWCRIVMSKAKMALINYVAQCGGNEMRNCPQVWDSVEIEEESEEGHKMKSRIQVPLQLSFDLHRFISSICWELHCLGGFTVPRDTLNFLLGLALEVVAESFSQLTEAHHRDSITQATAVQILFDINVASNFLNWRPSTEEGKKELNERKAQLKHAMAEVKNRIDPFDYDVLSPILKQNVNHFTLKHLAVFGLLLSGESLSFLSRLPVSKQSSEAETAQILPVSVASGDRFVLLPVPVETNISKPSGNGLITSYSSADILGGVNRESLGGMKHSASVASALLQKSSSFYDRISQGWFGM